MTKEKKFKLSDWTLIVWNPGRQLPYEIFIFRILIVFLLTIGSIIYYTPNKDLPELISNSLKLIRRADTEWSLETLPTKVIGLLLMVFCIVIASRA